MHTSTTATAHANATMTADDGTLLSFQDCGEGEPLILLHALTGTGSDWRHVFDLDALAVKYRVVVPDARGHGCSTNPTGVFTFRRCALDVLGLLDRLGIDRFRAVGMSLGAKTLLHVATLVPERVSKLVLVSATPRFPDETRAWFRRFAALEHSPEEWATMREKHRQGDAQIAWLWHLPAQLADDQTDMSFSEERLRVITAQTLIVAGDRDRMYPVELAVDLYRGIPNSALYVVPNGGHVPIFEQERANFADRALTFLAER